MVGLKYPIKPHQGVGATGDLPGWKAGGFKKLSGLKREESPVDRDLQ